MNVPSLRRRRTQPESVRASTLSRSRPILRTQASGTVLETVTIDGALVNAWNVTRELAMSVPTIAACRNLIVGTIAQLDVERTRGNDRLLPGTLLTAPDPDVPWSTTIGWTVDDLVFRGRAYWLVLARDPDGFPVRARYVPAALVEEKTSAYLTDYSRVVHYDVNGSKVDPGDVIAFRMPHEGVLSYGARTISQAVALADAARRFADVEIPAGVLQNEGHELSQPEADELVAAFQEQRRTKSVAFLQGVKYERTNIAPADLQLNEAQGAVATECARLMGVPVVMVGASPSGSSGSSLLYSNMGENTAAFIAQACAPVLVAVEDALSSPAITPRGQTIHFAVGKYLRSDPGSAVDYVSALVDKNIISTDEARSFLGIPPAGARDDTVDLTPGRV